jgi:hypothetical protein
MGIPYSFYLPLICDEQSYCIVLWLDSVKVFGFLGDHIYMIWFLLGSRFEMSAAVQAGIPFWS